MNKVTFIGIYLLTFISLQLSLLAVITTILSLDRYHHPEYFFMPIVFICIAICLPLTDLLIGNPYQNIKSILGKKG